MGRQVCRSRIYVKGEGKAWRILTVDKGTASIRTIPLIRRLLILVRLKFHSYQLLGRGLLLFEG